MSTFKTVYIATGLVLFALVAQPLLTMAQCPEEPPLQNFTGAGTTACPCFVAGEQAGAVLQAPAAHYPLEILRVGVGWGSFSGGNPQQIEQAIHIYNGGLPNPGSPIFTLLGPQLTDGAINEYDLEPIPGEITVGGGPITVTLEFLNTNSDNIFDPSVVHDGNGCQAGKNVVYAIPGGWTDACGLGISGDWIFYVVYRPCVPTGVDDGPFVLSTGPAYLQTPRPNPFASSTDIEFVLQRPGRAEVSVFDVGGHRVASLTDQTYPEGAHSVTWSGRDSAGRTVPSGIYFVRLQVGDYSSVKKILFAK